MKIISPETQSAVIETALTNLPVGTRTEFDMHIPEGEELSIESELALEPSWAIELSRRGMTVRFEHTNPNTTGDFDNTKSLLEIYKGSELDQKNMKMWVVSSPSREWMERETKINYIESNLPVRNRVSTNPDRTYIALARLASIHINRLSQQEY